MNILVTGGSGFLGKHLCRAVRDAGHTVRVLDHTQNSEFETVVGDVRDSALVHTALDGIEAVFHLASSIQAGESVQKPREYADNNIMGTITVLEAMRQRGVARFIFSSSAAVYGEPVRVPIFEDDRTIPVNPYGMTKLAMEGLASSYAYAFGMSAVALRYFNLYGPGEDHEPETHAIPRFIHQINTGKEVTIYGSGEHKRDYVYVADIVNAHIRCLDLPLATYSYFNLSGENATSVAELVGKIETLLAKKAKKVFLPPRPGDPLLLFADSTKAKQHLGWEAQTTLDEGLQKTIEWCIANPTLQSI